MWNRRYRRGYDRHRQKKPKVVVTWRRARDCMSILVLCSYLVIYITTVIDVHTPNPLLSENEEFELEIAKKAAVNNEEAIGDLTSGENAIGDGLKNGTDIFSEDEKEIYDVTTEGNEKAVGLKKGADIVFADDDDGALVLPRRSDAVMIIAVLPNSINRMSAIWSQLECFANKYERIVIACEEGDDLLKTALANLRSQLVVKMPEIAGRLVIQYFVNNMWDTGLWCNALTVGGLLEKGSNGTYVGGIAKDNFTDFLLINDSAMAVEYSNELMETLHAKDLALASFSFWLENEAKEEPYWVESYARAFSLEGIQIFADKICSRGKKISWREDCPDMKVNEKSSTDKRRKKCVVRLTEIQVASHYPRHKVHGIYPGKVPVEMVIDGVNSLTSKVSWTGHYPFWSSVLRDQMNFPLVKISDQEFLTHAMKNRPDDFAKCTQKMDKNILNRPFVAARENQLLWLGEQRKPAIFHTLEVVVSYCRSDLSWIHDDILRKAYTRNIRTVNLNILSKCGNDDNIQAFDSNLVSQVNIVNLRHDGGHNYAYAHFINDYVSRHTKETELALIVFTTDTQRTKMDNFNFPRHRRYKNLKEMIDSATVNEFVCGMITDCDVSPYHKTGLLYDYKGISASKVKDGGDGTEAENAENFNIHEYEDLRDFHARGLGWTFPPSSLTRVCYGDIFAVPASRLISLSHQGDKKEAMQRMVKALSRSNEAGTIIEENFAERTWAGLFSTPLTEDETSAIYKLQADDNIRSGNTIKRQGSVYGALIAHKNLC